MSIAPAHPSAQAPSKRVTTTERLRPTPVAVRKHLPVPCWLAERAGERWHIAFEARSSSPVHPSIHE
ncbi:MAG: hypothetical protein JWR26_2304, partial [Pedosphaera sp.]|nr:hypothetical protein [Pedosphaera sp.]